MYEQEYMALRFTTGLPYGTDRHGGSVVELEMNRSIFPTNHSRSTLHPWRPYETTRFKAKWPRLKDTQKKQVSRTISRHVHAHPLEPCDLLDWADLA